MEELKQGFSPKKLAALGLFLAFAMILSYVEFLIPFSFGIPGVKLGLANAAILLSLYLLGWRSAFLISLSRIFLSALLFGNVLSLSFALTGGILSLLVMAVLYSLKKFHAVSISAAGGMAHNFGQLLAACLLIRSLKLIYYLPILLISGFLTGLLIGIICQEILLRKWISPRFLP